MSDRPPDVALRDLAQAARKSLEQMNAKGAPGSPRRSEEAQARSTRGGGGRSRADLLGKLQTDVCFLLVASGHMLEGAADLLQVARANRDLAVNAGALTAVVRPSVEAAALVAYLLDPAISVEERTRRYMVWRFDELSSERRFARDSGLDANNEAMEGLTRAEAELLEQAERAGWSARPSNIDGQHARLLKPNGKAAEMPKISERVRDSFDNSGLYNAMSLGPHSGRVGIYSTIERQGPTPGRRGLSSLKMASFGLPVPMAIRVGVLATMEPLKALAAWSSFDVLPALRVAAYLVRVTEE